MTGRAPLLHVLVTLTAVGDKFALADGDLGQASQIGTSHQLAHRLFVHLGGACDLHVHAQHA
eukprot:8442495-Alexandrium_andersonii.AAC.1